MISMQRSTSLPGPAQASSSRPSIETANSQNGSSHTPRHSPSSSRHILRNEITQTDPEPLIAPISQNSPPTIPLNIDEISSEEPIQASAPGRPTRIYRPLLDEDVSQYTSISIKDAATEANSTTLEELAHLVRLSTYQVRKRTQTRVRLQRSLVSTALSARLERCGELALRTLVDSFRSDDKKSFSTLYNAIHDVSKSCDAAKKYAVLEPDLEKNSRLDDTSCHWTFIQEIPPPARETLFNFLTQVRTNTDYLADQLCKLSSTELQALTVFHHGLEPVDSVLPFHNRPRGKSTARSSTHAPSPVERLLSFQRHDPLSALIHTCFANSAGPDSAEHFRRTEVWATVCARLISSEKKVGVDTFLSCVLNIWTSMREWSGRSNLEWYLMKILEEGAFLVEKSETYAGIRGHGEPRTAKDTIAAEEFYDSAVKGLFDIVNDSGGEGIPESVLELGNAILRKLDPKKHQGTRLFLVSKWLFHDFLLNAIVHPESHGMMNEYHISEYARQRILKEVALRAGRLVVDLTWKQTGATPSADIKAHIENIMGRFKTSKTSRLNPKLLPARSITSLRETAEVRPYIVVSPADLITMVNAVFPERRPTSGSGDSVFSGFRSTTSSLSGFSMASGPRPGSVTSPSRGFDTASTISEVESSIFSDATTSGEPLLRNNIGHAFSSTSISSMSQPQKPMEPVEDEGYRLRSAIREMSNGLGSDVVSGSCHPCAEQWAVLFMNSNGRQLSTHMLHDEDDAEDEELTSSSDSDTESVDEKPDLDKDYHQLRDAIVKLVGEFEIPRSVDENNGINTFSNRANSVSASRKNRSLRRKGHEKVLETQSRNPYRMYAATASAEDSKKKAAEIAETKTSVLLDMLEAAEKQCQAQSDFVNSHLYWRTSQQLHSLSSDSLRQNDFVSLLNICSRGPRDSIRRSAAAIEEYDAWLVWLKQSQERRDATIEAMIKRYRALRDKMWYVTDVRNSAAYDAARHVVLALRSMGLPKTKKQPISATSRGRNLNRPSATSYFGKTETQYLDLLAASDEHGGPNKLSDEQADQTWKWLSQFGIENFCKGEERIHRFCLEIDSCINKLVGESVMDGPVLWSSELYSWDKRYLDSGRQKGDLSLDSFGSMSIHGDTASDSASIHSNRSVRGFGFSPSSGTANLRTISIRNGSQQSFDSSRWGSSRMSISGDSVNSPDYFGHASPVLSIDTTATFWSPFENRVSSPTPSVRSFRPGTSSTTNETVMEAVADSDVPAKLVFLTELKQTLNALLISDLGSLVFSRGSETDAWFSGDPGQDCMDRKAEKDKREADLQAQQEAQERREKRRSRRGLEKKRSFRDLRIPQDKKSTLGGVPLEKTSSRGSSHPSNNGTSTPDHHSRTNSIATADSAAAAAVRQQVKESLPTDFPYKKAFRRLLTMFAVHPNPYCKLNALYELEHLVIASLTTVPRRRVPKHDIIQLSSKSPESPGHTSRKPSFDVPRAMNVGAAMDNCKERRSHTSPLSASASASTSAPQSPTTRKAERAASSPIATTDMIVDVLQNLFREQGMRPKTLFRDLQYIAAFVPASVLDKTDRGKAFWDAGLAALGLKQEVCRTMIDLADEIVKYHTSRREPSSSAASVPNSEGSSAHGATVAEVEEGNEMALYSMADAAKMWIITAKEGDPVAERELAICYLTHPELVGRTILPLSRPREVFRAVAGDAGGGRTGTGNARGGGDAGGTHPPGGGMDELTMCVACHWMEAARQGGDEVAKSWMVQRAEMGALPEARR